MADHRDEQWRTLAVAADVHEPSEATRAVVVELLEATGAHPPPDEQSTT